MLQVGLALMKIFILIQKYTGSCTNIYVHLFVNIFFVLIIILFSWKYMFVFDEELRLNSGCSSNFHSNFRFCPELTKNLVIQFHFGPSLAKLDAQYKHLALCVSNYFNQSWRLIYAKGLFAHRPAILFMSLKSHLLIKKLAKRQAQLST